MRRGLVGVKNRVRLRGKKLNNKNDMEVNR